MNWDSGGTWVQLYFVCALAYGTWRYMLWCEKPPVPPPADMPRGLFLFCIGVSAALIALFWPLALLGDGAHWLVRRRHDHDSCEDCDHRDDA